MKKLKNILPIIAGIFLLFISDVVLASGFVDKMSTSYLFLGLILFLGFLGFVIEIFTSGFGLGILVSVFSFSAFFILNSSNGRGIPYLSYFILGLVLLIIEVVVPGFTLVGIAGIVIVSLSIIATVPNMTYGVIMLIVVMIAIISIIVHMFRKGYSSDILDRLILRETHLDSVEDRKTVNPYLELLGREGKVLTDMRPSGIIEVDGQVIDAISEGLYIKKDERVKVVKVEGNKITVRRS